jgi:hypothetical protein
MERPEKPERPSLRDHKKLISSQCLEDLEKPYSKGLKKDYFELLNKLGNDQSLGLLKSDSRQKFQ